MFCAIFVMYSNITDYSLNLFSNGLKIDYMVFHFGYTFNEVLEALTVQSICMAKEHNEE